MLATIRNMVCHGRGSVSLAVNTGAYKTGHLYLGRTLAMCTQDFLIGLHVNSLLPADVHDLSGLGWAER